MLRILIGTGVLLMVVGFGAAGWQYWQSMAPGGDADATAQVADGSGAIATPVQDWLISETGGLVSEPDVAAFLVQDRLIRDRMVTFGLTAPLASLLAEGEALPAEAFLPVFADIRAPQLARPLCPVLTEGIAAACAVQSARLVEGSVDPARGTARFKVELAYRLKPAPADLPDLALHVLSIETRAPAQPVPAASAEAALATALASAAGACAGADRALGCRLMALTVDWAPGGPVSFEARLGWLRPLPEGMIPVTPIAPPPAEG